ncbi:MAG: MarR family transcriptional regulator [Phyllobacteriaceae bacterium]|nr:MarR family transcriptional regulator [Phyllobacteriaceae bacterium]
MEPSPDHALFGQLVTRVARHWRRAVDRALAGAGLSQATALPLLVLSRLGPELRQGVIAEELGLERPSLVRIVDILLAEGLVERVETPSDRRAKLLRLTDLGREQVCRIETAVAELRARHLAAVDAADLDATVRCLGLIEATLIADTTA